MRRELVLFDGWPHIIKAQPLAKRDWVERVFFPLSRMMENMMIVRSCAHLLEGKEMISLFCAESTRTRASEEIAMHKLGGRVVFSAPGAKFSSAMGKGENLADTIEVLCEYGADVIVVRNDNPNEIPITELAARSSIPIINAGDNAEQDKQHPTQALLDLYTIYRHLGKIDGITCAMIGDLKNGRTVRSLCYLLAKWQPKKIFFVSPIDFRIGDDIKEYLHEHSVAYEECCDVRDALEADVFYQTRTQTNLGSHKWDRADEKNGLTIINGKVLSGMKEDAILMHPLPCLDEIVRSEVDDNHRAIYSRSRGDKPSQVKCGLITRMAELLIVISPDTVCSLL